MASKVKIHSSCHCRSIGPLPSCFFLPACNVIRPLESRFRSTISSSCSHCGTPSSSSSMLCIHLFGFLPSFLPLSKMPLDNFSNQSQGTTDDLACYLGFLSSYKPLQQSRGLLFLSILKQDMPQTGRGPGPGRVHATIPTDISEIV